jgi:organic radical activating enzyme
MEAIVNGPIANKTRLQFLNKESPRDCDSCWQREASGVTVGHPREFSNSLSTNVIASAISNTNTDGSLQNHKLKFFDIIWTNKCNFACLHCLPNLSSTIASNYKDTFDIWLNDMNDKNDFDYWANPDKINNNDKIEYILRNADSLELLHFNGGEPFLQEETFILLDELKKRNLQKKIKLWFHTNGSVRTYKNIDIIEDYIRPWGNAYINMSHDHFGARGEYFRYGYKDKKWLETYNRLISAGVEGSVDTSITLFNILTLDELVTWYLENGIIDKSVLGWNFITGPIIWNVHNLCYVPELRDELQQAMYRTLNILNAVKTPDHVSKFVSNINGLLKNIDNGYDYSTIENKFIRAVDTLDIKRATNFLQTFPELEPLYRKLKNDKSI